MNYSPTLKAAMEEIKAVLDKYDVAAAVVLHKPHYGQGMGEFCVRINPSYSCLQIKPDNSVRLVAKLEEFGGNKKARNEALTNTANMLKVMADLTGKVNNDLTDLSEAVDFHLVADHTTGSITDHLSTQN